MTDHNDAQDLDAQLLNQMRSDFLEEALELLDQLNLNLIQLEEEPDNEELMNQIFRIAHTIKGSAGFAGLEEMSGIGRKMEELFGEIRKGHQTVSPSCIQVMFEGLDMLSFLREKAAGNDSSPVDIEPVLRGLDKASGATSPADDEAAGEPVTESLSADDELFKIYKEGYDHLAALKHLIYASIHLYDEDTLAVLFSKQIAQKMKPERNSVWLLKNKQVEEIARDGNLVPEGQRQTIDIGSSPIVQRLINDQLVVWSSSNAEAKEILPGFESPVIIPIKAKPFAYGFLVLDPEESADVQVYQFVAEFAAMVLRISKLHRKVDEQRKELDEMTAILFRQNNILSSLYHIELDLMRVKNAVDLCRIVTEAFVHDLETRSAAIFIKDESATRLTGVWGSGGLQEINTLNFPVTSIEPIRQCLESGRIVSHNDSAGNTDTGAQ